MENGKNKDASGYLEVRLRNVRSRNKHAVQKTTADEQPLPRRVLISTAKLDLSKGKQEYYWM
jgi:hypothetical protein